MKWPHLIMIGIAGVLALGLALLASSYDPFRVGTGIKGLFISLLALMAISIGMLVGSAFKHKNK